MTLEIALVLLILLVAMTLFATEVLSVDLVTLLVLLALMATGILTVPEAFSGFSSEVIVALASLFVVTGALQDTGVVDRLARQAGALASWGLRRTLAAVMAWAGGLSAFLNNTTVAALFVGPVSSLGRTADVSPSRLLMPMAYATILGGTCTLIGTSTNVVVGTFMKVQGLPPAGMFEMAPVGLVLAMAGFVYLLAVSPHLLPQRKEIDVESRFSLRDYLSEFTVKDASPLIGGAYFGSALARDGFRMLRLVRGGRDVPLQSRTRAAAGDTVLVEGRIDLLMAAGGRHGIEIRPELKQFAGALDPEKSDVAEVIVLPHSELEGKTLKESRFRQRYGLLVLAVSRAQRSLRSRLARIRLKAGDVLLVQGAEETLEALRDDRDLARLQTQTPRAPRVRRGIAVALMFGAAVIANAAGWMPLAFSFLSAAVGCVLVRAVSMSRAYELIEWRLLILVGGMIAMGTAMAKTGAAELLGHTLAGWLAPLGPTAALAGVCLLTMALTQPMSNAAAALVMLPVALSMAEPLGLAARTLCFAVMLSASVSLIAPLEPACVLVYAPGRYRIVDFIRLGAPLTLLLLLLIVVLCPWYWN